MSADISAILDDLAAGRINAAEANRRIAAAQSESQSPDDQERAADRADEDSPEEPPSASGPSEEPNQPHGSPRPGGVGWSTAREVLGEGWSRVPPEARQGLRSAWERVSDVAGSMGGGGDSAPGPRRARPSSPDSPTTPPADLERVALRCTGRRVHVIGDATVSGVRVDGDHVRRRVGSTTEITCEGRLAPDLSGLLRLRVPRDLDGVKDLGLGREVVIRVHPDVPVDIEVSGGSLRVEGLGRLGTVRVTAAMADLSGVRQLENGLVQAGNATIGGTFEVGRSRVRVESGNLTVRLEEGANVAVRAATRTALISWPEAGQVDEYIVGNGAARLDLSVVVGRVAVRNA